MHFCRALEKRFSRSIICGLFLERFFRNTSLADGRPRGANETESSEVVEVALVVEDQPLSTSPVANKSQSIMIIARAI
jgi:hypothetical protein